MEFEYILEEWGKEEGQDCDTCPLRNINNGVVCIPLFEKTFGASCSTHRVVFLAKVDENGKAL